MLSFMLQTESIGCAVLSIYAKCGGYWYDLDGGYQNEEIFKSYFVF